MSLLLFHAWGGLASDRHITENCGLLKHLNPGDVIQADRGFTVEDSIAMYCAKLKMPAFTKGKEQLTGREVDVF